MTSLTRIDPNCRLRRINRASSAEMSVNGDPVCSSMTCKSWSLLYKYEVLPSARSSFWPSGRMIGRNTTSILADTLTVFAAKTKPLFPPYKNGSKIPKITTKTVAKTAANGLHMTYPSNRVMTATESTAAIKHATSTSRPPAVKLKTFLAILSPFWARFFSSYRLIKTSRVVKFTQSAINKRSSVTNMPTINTRISILYPKMHSSYGILEQEMRGM